MKTKTVETITSNEEMVRLRIFDGDLNVSDAAAELLRLERAQHAETRRLLAECRAAHARIVTAEVKTEQ